MVVSARRSAGPRRPLGPLPERLKRSACALDRYWIDTVMPAYERQSARSGISRVDVPRVGSPQEPVAARVATADGVVTTTPVSYTHLRAHETPEHLVCRLLLE